MDLVALDGNTLVFIEVKFRTNNRFSQSFLAVTKHQQQSFPTPFYNMRSSSAQFGSATNSIVTDQKEKASRMALIYESANPRK